MYVLPSDAVDRSLDTNGTIRNSIAAISGWFAGQTGGPQLRWDTCDGALDIGFARLPNDDATITSHGVYVRDEVQDEMAALGWNDPMKIYAVYYDGGNTAGCGQGPWPPDLVGHVGAIFLKGTPPGAPPCATNPVGSSATEPHYFEFALIHEVMHTIGLVASCAPHFVSEGHVSDSPNDLMYAGTAPWTPSILDVGHNDYWHAGIPGCLDLSSSAFLEPLPDAAEAPPGW
jgi:hypothetical protein